MARRNRTTRAQLEAEERQRQALNLRKSGALYPEIAEALGYASPSGAYEAVKTAMRKTLQEPADELREMELARLDELQIGVWEAACAGDADSINAALRIMGHRARLLGLERKDTPIKTTLPKLEGAKDAVAFIGELVGKVTAGEISPDDANRIAGLLGVFVKSAEATELAEKLARLEEMALAGAEKGNAK